MNKHLFVVGTQRSGTTYLYRMLNAHPKIMMAKPERPEPKYFLRDDLHTLSPADYTASYFAGAPDDVLCGEKSTSYIEYEHAAARIAAWFPDAHIIVCLRNPIERALSNYYFTHKYGIEPLSIADAFRQEEQRRDNYDKTKISVSPYAYLKRGVYMDYLPFYTNRFPNKQIHIVIFERFTQHLTALQTIYEKLGVDSTFIPAGHGITANANAPYNQTIPHDLKTYLVDYFRPSVEALKAYLGDNLTEWAEFG